MRLTFIENPNNPLRIWIVNLDNPTEKLKGTGCLYEYQFTRPLKTTEPDADRLIIQAIKIYSGKLTGFESWQEAAIVLSTIEDAEATANALGHDINALLNG